MLVGRNGASSSAGRSPVTPSTPVVLQWTNRSRPARLVAAGKQTLRAHYVRPQVLRGRDARDEQWPGEMVDHLHAV